MRDGENQIFRMSSEQMIHESPSSSTEGRQRKSALSLIIGGVATDLLLF